jgi:hypothetical protein
VKCTFQTVVGPGVVVEAKDQPAEGPVLLFCHLAIMPHLIVKFSAPSWGGFTVIESGAWLALLKFTSNKMG